MHGGGAVGPEGDALRGLPFLVLDEGGVGAGRAAPVDAARLVLGAGGAVLPEVVAEPGPPPAVIAEDHGRGEVVGRGEKRRQRRGKGGRAGPQAGGGFGRHAAARARVAVAAIVSMIAGRFSPRARAAKPSAMR